MSYLTKLNVVTLRRAEAIDPVAQRRNKLVLALQEQIEAARAQEQGKRHVTHRSAWTRDTEGNKKRVQKERIVRAWWWEENKEIMMCVRYGARILELAAGKRAVKIGSYAQIAGTLNTLISATQAGELDAAIAAALKARKTRA